MKRMGAGKESLLTEAHAKFIKAENSSPEYRFYGAVVNEIRWSLKERLEQRMRKRKEDRRIPEALMNCKRR